MTENDLNIHDDGHVRVIEFDRPPNNFFDVSLLRSLAEAFEEADRDPNCRAILLCSSGRVFCAGADFSQNNDPSGQAGPKAVYAEAARMFGVAIPVIAVIQGPAIGGGFGLAMMADFRIAAPEARFAANFVHLGIHPGFGLTHTLPRALGQQAAALLLYTGRRIDGKEAERLGVVDQLVPADEVRAAGLRLAAEIAAGAPLALEATRATLRGNLAQDVAGQMAHEAAEQLKLFATADHREGIQAVSERRPGQFQRR